MEFASADRGATQRSGTGPRVRTHPDSAVQGVPALAVRFVAPAATHAMPTMRCNQ